MSIPLYLTVVGCVISAGMGFVAAVFVKRPRREIPVETPSEPQPVQTTSKAKTNTNPKPEADVDLLVSSLFELTSHVNTQVNEHSQRVGEITDSITAGGDMSPEAMLDAGKSLIEVNQKLQSDLEQAKQDLKEQRDLMASFMQESLTDPLTGVANRRAFDRELNRMFAIRRRHKSTFSVMILDIDYFKRVNDGYGHMVGDQLLKSFTRNLIATFRESDFIARFGGEEFVVIMPQLLLEEACCAADRIRKVIAESRHMIGDVELQVTASIGVKEVQGSETDAELLEKVDKALYSAKHAGRNCCFYHDGMMRRRYLPGDGAVIADLPPEADHANGDSDSDISIVQSELVHQ